MKKTILFLVLIVSVLFNCTNKTKESKSGQDRFPGFSQAGNNPESSMFYADLKSISRVSNGVSFKMVRVVEGGYVIQDAGTNCKDGFIGLEGVQYKNDGTSDRKYPADAVPVKIEQNPGLSALVKLVCEKADEGRALPCLSLDGMEPGDGFFMGKDKLDKPESEKCEDEGDEVCKYLYPGLGLEFTEKHRGGCETKCSRQNNLTIF